jgi:hypothetical protein
MDATTITHPATANATTVTFIESLYGTAQYALTGAVTGTVQVTASGWTMDTAHLLRTDLRDTRAAMTLELYRAWPQIDASAEAVTGTESEVTSLGSSYRPHGWDAVAAHIAAHVIQQPDFVAGQLTALAARARGHRTRLTSDQRVRELTASEAADLVHAQLLMDEAQEAAAQCRQLPSAAMPALRRLLADSPLRPLQAVRALQLAMA